MTEHILKAFDEDLREISSRLAEMGGIAERLVAEFVDALVKRDTLLAQRVIAADDSGGPTSAGNRGKVDPHDRSQAADGNRFARDRIGPAHRKRS